MQLLVMAYHSQLPGLSRLPLEVCSAYTCHWPYSAEHTEDCIMVVRTLSLSISIKWRHKLGANPLSQAVQQWPLTCDIITASCWGVA